MVIEEENQKSKLKLKFQWMNIEEEISKPSIKIHVSKVQGVKRITGFYLWGSKSVQNSCPALSKKRFLQGHGCHDPEPEFSERLSREKIQFFRVVIWFSHI